MKRANFKREKRSSLLFRAISSKFILLASDVPELEGVFVSRVGLSNDCSSCYVYFSTHSDKEKFDNAYEILRLYKASFRNFLAKELNMRYTPHLSFRYDDLKEKERRLGDILSRVMVDDEEGERDAATTKSAPGGEL